MVGWNRALLDGTAHLEGVDGVKPTITDDASKDVPCGDGKVKRVFTGSFPFKPRPDVDANFDFAFKLVLADLEAERYELAKEPDSDDLARREFVATGKDDLKARQACSHLGVSPSATCGSMSTLCRLRAEAPGHPP